MSVSIVGVTIAAFVIVTAIATALLRDVLAAIIVFAAYSLGMAIFYSVLLAPDVALTEAAIGAGITTVLLILTISRTVRERFEALAEPPNWSAVAVVGLFVLVVAWTMASIAPVGSPTAIAWANPEVTQYYLTHAYADTGVRNAVTAVLASYRGFDTFGEAIVVFTVGVAVVLVLNRRGFA